MNISAFVDLVAQLNKERGWYKTHKTSRLLIALITELGELAEFYKWKAEGQPLKEAQKQGVADELADILIYVACIALVEDIDLETAILRKLHANGLKYPVKEDL
jgi:dCTP diphosphatase